LYPMTTEQNRARKMLNFGHDVSVSAKPSFRIIRFSTFELNLQTGELHQQGRKLKLQEQSFQVLAALLERPGEIVTREELRSRLWSVDTFVDFDHSLNAAIKRLRDALGESPEAPIFIETLARRGYRFIAPVNLCSAPSGIRIANAPEQSKSSFLRHWVTNAGGGILESPLFRETLPQVRRLRLVYGVVLLLILIAVAIGGWLLSRRVPRVTTSTQLSFSGLIHAPGGYNDEVYSTLATDGTRIYSSASTKEGPSRLGYVSTAGGEQVSMTVPLERPQLRHISPDGSMLLAYASSPGESESHLWLVPTAGGGPRRLGNIDGQDGAWSPDGREIIYANEQDLYVARSDGSDARKIATTPGKAFWLRWSPDATRIRFTLVDSKTASRTLWQCRADGTDLHRLPLSWDKQPQECCGEWTPDGTYFFFRAARDNSLDIWLIRDTKYLEGTYKPTRLTSGALGAVAAISSRDGKRLFAVEGRNMSETFKYDLRTRKLMPFLPGSSVCCVSTSPDGRWIAYNEVRGAETILWRSKPDGSERVQLSSPPIHGGWPTWSPDGKYIASFSKAQDGSWRIYVFPASGGSPRDPLPKERNVVDPEWSPDGHSLMFGRPPTYWVESSTRTAISILNMDTDQITTLPQSEGLFSPRWSPNGRYVAAMPLSQRKLMLFDFATQSWTELAHGTNQNPKSFDNPRWSPEGEYLYANEEAKGVLIRVDTKTRKLEEIADSKTIEPTSQGCEFFNLAGKGAIWIGCGRLSSNIYALDLDLP